MNAINASGMRQRSRNATSSTSIRPESIRGVELMHQSEGLEGKVQTKVQTSRSSVWAQGGIGVQAGHRFDTTGPSVTKLRMIY